MIFTSLPDNKEIILGIIRDADNALTRGVIQRRSGLSDLETDKTINSLVKENKITFFPEEDGSKINKFRYLTVAEEKESIEGGVARHLWELSAGGLLYFAYGSDLDPGEMYRVRCPGSHFLCKGYIEGFDLSFDLYMEEWRGTVPSIKFSGSSRQVWGAVYCIKSGDWEKLDLYEGVPKINRRVNVPVHTAFGLFCAGGYQSLPGDKKLPSEKYMEKLLGGAEFFGLPQKYVRYIKSLPVNRASSKEKT
ncbi:MAG: gamma-glutamylcyclotransferase family protein [Desulfocucumaceae bacterium]